MRPVPWLMFGDFRKPPIGSNWWFIYAKDVSSIFGTLESFINTQVFHGTKFVNGTIGSEYRTLRKQEKACLKR